MVTLVDKQEVLAFLLEHTMIHIAEQVAQAVVQADIVLQAAQVAQVVMVILAAVAVEVLAAVEEM
jgi:hypothetical protein